MVKEHREGPEPTQDTVDPSFQRLLEDAAKISDIGPATHLAAGDTLFDGRFTIRGALGEGGMGVVYEAWDRARHSVVALKTLGRSDPRAIYFLKNEFRSLAEVTHPNLVALHEFFEERGRWFFTMERVRGRDFFRHVSLEEDPQKTRRAADARFDEALLRDATSQMVQGVAAVHEAGKLHCDLKPANVMVEPGGRVVLLDFGLVSEQGEDRLGHTLGHVAIGTPAYMSPEQGTRSGAVPASDMYAVGVMLYVALTGRLPFDGPGPGILARKQIEDPSPPSNLAAGIPPDLERLCIALMSRDPEARPDPTQVLEALGVCSGAVRVGGPSVAPTGDAAPAFVGREAELTRLGTLLEEAGDGPPRVVAIDGPAGIGKSALLREFTDRAATGQAAPCLRGRCHERENIPYNAFDRVIDELSRELRRLDPVEAAALLPRDTHTLVRLFPILGRVEAVVRCPGRSGQGLEPLEVRRRGFAALRELLARMSDVTPIVLVIDDFQWADEDSLRLLQSLLEPPEPPRMLVVVTRLDDDGSPRDPELPVDVEHIRLGPLALDEARDLAGRVIGSFTEPIEPLLKEARGNPFFLGELLQYRQQAPEGTATELKTWIAERLAQLPDEARAMLELLSLARPPLELPVLVRAAELEDAGQLLTQLHNARWIRSHRAGNRERVELYHDRIARAVVNTIDPDRRRQHHQSLAAALADLEPIDHERLAEHRLQAGDSARATGSLIAAAERADQAFAFATAANLYGVALVEGQFTDADRRQVLERLADARSRAGRAGEAATAYLQAAELYQGAAERTRLRRLGAQHMLACGRLEEGTKILRTVVDEAGVEYPDTPGDAESALQQLRGRLDLDASDFTVTSQPESDARVLAQIDVCCAAGPALGSYDFMRSGYFAARGLALARDAGEPSRLARALAMYSTTLASSGELTRAAQYSDRALQIARDRDQPELVALGELAQGQVALFEGDFDLAVERCDAARERFQNLHLGTSLEVPVSHVFSNMALFLAGRLSELVSRSRTQLSETRDRGHILAEASLRSFGVGLGALADDDVDQARAHARRAGSAWPQQGFHGEQFKVLRLEAWCDLYEGKTAQAAARVARARETALDSRLLGSRYWRFWWYQLTAQIALGAAADGHGDGHLADAQRAIAELDTDGLPYAEPYILTFRAALDAIAGDSAAADRLMRRAERLAYPTFADCIAHERAGMAGDATAAARARDRLQQTCSRPEHFARLFVPSTSRP